MRTEDLTVRRTTSTNVLCQRLSSVSCARCLMHAGEGECRRVTRKVLHKKDGKLLPAGAGGFRSQMAYRRREYARVAR